MHKSGMITRGDLTRTFNELADERIIYVCAPGGYGKTVAVRQWLDANKRARAVISLDEYDNKQSHFCERFCAALRDCQPRNEALAEIVSHPSFVSAPDEYTIRAIAALSKRRFSTLVIDDLHIIQNDRILRILLAFLKRLPDNFKIIIISRHDLPSGFSDLWVKGHLSIITAKQLIFSSEEIMLLYKKRGIAITQKQADEIFNFTKGWAIGINALLLSGGEPSGENLTYLEDYIKQSVWQRWDEPTRDFMIKTAAARKLVPELCDILAGIEGSAKMLDRLMHSGAFVFQASDGVYHYHHLFHGFLNRMLSERGTEFLFGLIKKEGDWLCSRAQFYDAIDSFIRCKCHDGIVKCFDTLEFKDRNDFVIELMVSIIQNPEVKAAAKRYPSIYFMMAWCSLAEGRADDMTASADQYYAHFPEIAARDPNRAHNIVFMRIFDFRTPLLKVLTELSSLSITPNSNGVRGSVTMNMPMLHRSTRDFSEFACDDIEGFINGMREVIGWLFGEEAGLLAESLTAGLLYEQGQLEKAYNHALAASSEIKKHFVPESKFCALSVLVYVLDSMGQSNNADDILSDVAGRIEQDKAFYLNYNYNALVTRRKLSNGDLSAAKKWLASHEASRIDEHQNIFGIYEAFTSCRAYITCADYDSALRLLKKILVTAKACNRPLDILESQILLAIAFWKKKRSFQEEAIRILEDAVATAYPYQYVQMFINEGAELSGMLRRLQKRVEQRGENSPVPSSFIKMLHLKSLEHPNTGLTSNHYEKSEKYTDKQKSVMRLLCAGKSYREITEIMGIKLPTLRSHISLIYKKLDVTTETQAIIKIQTLGLLD